MRTKKQTVGLARVNMISCPRVERSPFSFATDVADGGVSPDPCSALLVVTLVVSANLVAFGLMLCLTEVASHWLSCECSATKAGSGDGWHGLGLGVGAGWASSCCLDQSR